MSDMHALFVGPAYKRLVVGARSLAGVMPRSSTLKTPIVSPSAEMNRRLHVLLKLQIAETDQLHGLLCSLHLPILHLSADLRLRRFSQAAA